MFKVLIFPLFLLAVFLSLILLWGIFNLPSQGELIEIARSYFARYGLVTVFVSSILEGMLFAGWYYPGSLVIFLGVIFAGKNIFDVAVVVALVTTGLYLAYIFDYILGKYGWYRLFLRIGFQGTIDSAQERLSKYGAGAIGLTYWHPNFAGLTATAAGILRFPLKKFLIFSLAAAIFWDAFWGTLVYLLGEAALSLMGVRFALILLGIWIFWRLIFAKKSVPKIP